MPRDEALNELFYNFQQSDEYCNDPAPDPSEVYAYLKKAFPPAEKRKEFLGAENAVGQYAAALEARAFIFGFKYATKILTEAKA